MYVSAMKLLKLRTLKDRNMPIWLLESFNFHANVHVFYYFHLFLQLIWHATIHKYYTGIILPPWCSHLSLAVHHTQPTAKMNHIPQPTTGYYHDFTFNYLQLGISRQVCRRWWRKMQYPVLTQHACPLPAHVLRTRIHIQLHWLLLKLTPSTLQFAFRKHSINRTTNLFYKPYDVTYRCHIWRHSFKSEEDS